MKLSDRIWVFVVFAMFCFASNASAQLGLTGEGISVAGTGKIERRATLLRVRVQLVGQGADVKTAISRIKEAQDAARKKLVDLGAAEAGIKFSGMQMDVSATDPRQQAMMQMMQQRMGSRGKKPTTGPAAAKPVKLTVQLQADFPLAGANDEEVLVNASELSKKVRDADISNKKGGASTLSPQEQEEAEEGQVEMQQQYGQPQVDPLEPIMSYVAKLSDADRDFAAAEAFKEATAEATRIAKAVHVELAGLRSVTSNSGSDNSQAQMMRMYGYYNGETNDSSLLPAPDEAIGQQPIAIKYHVTIMASFNVKNG